MNNNEILQLLANSNDGVIAVGVDNKILFWNKSAQKILGYKPKEVLGKSYKEIIPATDINGNPVCLGSYSPGNSNNGNSGVESYEIVTNSKKARKIWLNLSVFKVSSSNSEHGMSVYIFRDITRQKIYEKIIIDVISKTDIADQFGSTIASVKTVTESTNAEIKLTTREREILLLLADGHSTKSISSKLYIALSTLRKHIRNIYSKLRAHSMLQAIAVARKYDLL